MNNQPLKYIVVEGPVGIGKTVLAKRLSKTFKTELLLENPADNPFLAQSCEDPRTSALPTQLFFLFQRLKIIETLRQADMFKPAQTSDFLIQKDRLFAEVTLNDDEFDLYNQVYNRLVLDVPIADLVIYLQAPVDVLLKRIRERGISYERKIDSVYLGRVAEAYINFFYHYNESPILIVNTTDINLLDSCDDYTYLLDYIRKLSPGKHYLNPHTL